MYSQLIAFIKPDFEQGDPRYAEPDQDCCSVHVMNSYINVFIMRVFSFGALETFPSRTLLS